MIWCVEDDGSIRDIEVYALQSAGLAARGFADGSSFWEAVQRERPDLVVLDIMLPGVDGVELLRRIRERPELSAIPVVMATAKGAEYDKVQSLDLGADYYLTKPFGVMELMSRIKAVLRRTAPRQAEDGVLALGDIVLDNARHTVTSAGEPVILTLKEFDLLHYLLQNADLVLTREKIMESVWGFGFEGESRTVDMHIKTLRQKLGAAGAQIHTVRGVGYKIGADVG